MSLDFAEHGACHLPGAAKFALRELEELSRRLEVARAGHRLDGDESVRSLVAPGGQLHQIVADRLGDGARAVRAIFFDKSSSANWALGWHQDRTIAVTERHDVEGFGPWTVKSGILHAAPPFSLLARMMTMRIHLDDVPPDNAPLLIAPGSHLAGMVAEKEIAEAIARFGTFACVAQRGDIWLYSTPILHASERAHGERRRRVLQLDFSAEKLPQPLEWRGI